MPGWRGRSTRTRCSRPRSHPRAWTPTRGAPSCVPRSRSRCAPGSPATATSCATRSHPRRGGTSPWGCAPCRTARTRMPRCWRCTRRPTSPRSRSTTSAWSRSPSWTRSMRCWARRSSASTTPPPCASGCAPTPRAGTSRRRTSWPRPRRRSPRHGRRCRSGSGGCPRRTASSSPPSTGRRPTTTRPRTTARGRARSTSTLRRPRGGAGTRSRHSRTTRASPGTTCSSPSRPS